MISKNRSFTRLPPDRDAKSIYIFCEGAKREYQYFLFFKGLDSRVNVEVHKLNPKVNNSPLGLLEIAKACLIQSKNNPCPKYELIPGDEVWIVFDTDDDKKQSRKPQIAELKNECNQKKAGLPLKAILVLKFGFIIIFMKTNQY